MRTGKKLNTVDLRTNFRQKDKPGEKNPAQNKVILYEF